MSFYGSDLGNRLIAEQNYPESIKNFLHEENKIIVSWLSAYDIFIEVGCMEGRYCERIIELNKSYIGIDISNEYIENAKMKHHKHNAICEFLCLDAEKLDEIIADSCIYANYNKPLFFFPFNSFGNISNAENVLKCMNNLKNATCLIFSYKTDEASTSQRLEYYSNCNYLEMKSEASDIGVKFTSSDGLNTIAYNLLFMTNLCEKYSLKLDKHYFCSIGIMYIIKN